MKRDDASWLVDAFTTEVMQARWRTDALCAHIDTYDKCAKRERETLCAACPVSEPCFWAALIEERAFRSGTVDPPGVRGGVNGAKRRFILRELTDQQIMNRYRKETQQASVAARSSAA
jgi:Transcription factor WhiB